MSKSKYEDGRGVCVLKWHQGLPNEMNCYGHILIETWTPDLSLGWSQADVPRLKVRAQLRFARWASDAKVWRLEDGSTYAESAHGAVRRWARLSVRYAHVNLTVDKWGVV
jgi:hypothetical protein